MKAPPPAHLPSAPSLRSSRNQRAFRLREPQMPQFNGSPEGILEIVEWLDVEHQVRYERDASSTYCNIYATDVAYLMGVYLPRVWWNPNQLLLFAQGDGVVAAYGSTVHELSANALFDWLKEWSHEYGWRRATSFTEAQAAANRGRCVTICARHPNPHASGHVNIIAPESSLLVAERDAHGEVVRPVQSQAGGKNFKLSLYNKWWLSLAEYGVWINEPDESIPDTERESPKGKSSTKIPAQTAEIVPTAKSMPLWEHTEGEHTVKTDDD